MSTKQLQEIFDTCAAHLLKQGQRSVDPVGVCSYRGTDGLKCAVGALIKDEFYKPSLEGYSPASQDVREALELSGIDMSKSGTLHLMLQLQSIHDKNSIYRWPPRLRKVAEINFLSTQVLDQ